MISKSYGVVGFFLISALLVVGLPYWGLGVHADQLIKVTATGNQTNGKLVEVSSESGPKTAIYVPNGSDTLDKNTVPGDRAYALLKPNECLRYDYDWTLTNQTDDAYLVVLAENRHVTWASHNCSSNSGWQDAIIEEDGHLIKASFRAYLQEPATIRGVLVFALVFTSLAFLIFIARW